MHASALPMAHIYAPAPYVIERVSATMTLSVLGTPTSCKAVLLALPGFCCLCSRTSIDQDACVYLGLHYSHGTMCEAHAYACFMFTASQALTSIHLLVLQRRLSVCPIAIPCSGCKTHNLDTNEFFMYCLLAFYTENDKGMESAMKATKHLLPDPKNCPYIRQ